MNCQNSTLHFDLLKQREFSDRLGSPYAAAMYVAKKARNIRIRSQNLLTESEAIQWVIDQKSEYDLDKYIKEFKHHLCNRKYSLINEYASDIDDVELRIQFQKSANDSKKNNILSIDYGNLDTYKCTRLRILLKQYWNEHITTEIPDVPLRR